MEGENDRFCRFEEVLKMDLDKNVGKVLEMYLNKNIEEFLELDPGKDEGYRRENLSPREKETEGSGQKQVPGQKQEKSYPVNPYEGVAGG